MGTNQRREPRAYGNGIVTPHERLVMMYRQHIDPDGFRMVGGLRTNEHGHGLMRNIPSRSLPSMTRTDIIHPAHHILHDVSKLPEFDAEMYLSRVQDFSRSETLWRQGELFRQIKRARQASLQRFMGGAVVDGGSHVGVDKARKARQLEASRFMMQAPILTKRNQIREVVASDAPESPIYTIALGKTVTIRSIARTVFGGEKPNRMKEVKEAKNVGPHYDAYDGIFLPWTLHRNISGDGFVRAGFLPSVAVSSRDTLDEQAQHTRGVVGRNMYDRLMPLVAAELGEGTLTMVWHGTDRESRGPSVHEFYREEPGQYAIYGRQVLEEISVDGFSAL